MITQLKPGSVVSFHYPKTTLITATPEFKKRAIIVTRVRDLFLEPLTIDEYRRRPFVRRGRFLIIGREVRPGNPHKQMYWECTREHWQPVLLHVGLYNPRRALSKPVKILETGFNWTPTSRLQLGRVLMKLQDHDFRGLELRVFCDGLRVVRRAA